MIDTDAELSKFVDRVRSAPWIAVDTEADSLHAYPEKVCLVQLSTPEGDFLVDPLAGIDLTGLLGVLAQRELIMHGADYDLRLLLKHHNFVPSAIFDTMLASRLLGVTQFGLTNLAAQYLGVTLEKGSQKADWAQRPLTERMENYARNDTHHLKALSDQLKKALEEKGRLDWHQESCARLIADCAQLRQPDPELVWRIKGSHRLSRGALAVLREVWHWREDEATKANTPPYFILRHESLVDLSVAAASAKPFDQLVPPRFSDRRRATLQDAVQRGLAVPAGEQPGIVRQSVRRISDSHKRRFLEMQKRRDDRATELGIDPTLIASRAVLLDLAQDWNLHQAELMNWQRELLK